MSNIFSSENREYSSCFLFGNLFVSNLQSSSMSNGSSISEVLSIIIEYSRNTTWTNQQLTSSFSRGQCLESIRIVAFLLEDPHRLTKSIVLTSRVVERLMGPLRCPNKLRYESTSFRKFLLFI